MTASPDASLFGGRELEVTGERITAITLDSNVVVYAGSSRDHEFRIENVFTIDDPGGTDLTVRYDPYNRANPVRENLTELTTIIDSIVTSGRAYVDGVLELILGDGRTIRVEPNPTYEAWTYTVGNFILACPPGGFSTT